MVRQAFQEDADFTIAREHMVDYQICSRGITTPAVVDAFRKVPRHLFVPAAQQSEAYADYPLSIGYGQTISQPYIVALMVDKANLRPTDHVLEIGTGSGYEAAILSCLCKRVDTVERIPALAKKAQETFVKLGFRNVEVHVGDGSEGYAQAAPYDAIIVAAAAPAVPTPLRDQLTIGGRLVIPIGNSFQQDLQLWVKTKTDFIKESVTPVIFVPLIGKWGWENEHHHDEEY